MRFKCKCGCVVEQSNSNVQCEILDNNGDTAAFIECPECKCKIYIQIDNLYTMNLAKKVKKGIEKLSFLKSVNKPLPFKLYKETKLGIDKLRFTQEFLKNRYKGKIEVAKPEKEDENV